MADLQHTPTPWSRRIRWITSGNVDIARIHSVSKIGEAEAVANAEFIIGACNSHDALVEAVHAALVVAVPIVYGNGPVPSWVDKARAALAQARGEVTQ